jgi:hypothetical protein
LRYGWDPENPLSGEQPTARDLAAAAQIAAPGAAEATGEADVDDRLPSTKGAARAPRG